MSKMAWEISEMSENASGSGSLRELVALVAEATWSDNRKSLIGKAAERARISYRQAKSLFYGEITDPFHRSVTLMRRAAEELACRYEAIANGMEKTDPDFYGTDRARLIQAAHDLRNTIRALGDVAFPENNKGLSR